MKTLISILVVVTVAFFLASCNENSSFLSSPVGTTTDGNTPTTFTGSGDGETIAPNGMNYPQRHFVGTGTSSLTNGECTIVLDYWALPNGTSMLGTGKLTAANGNELQAINIAGTWTISGTTVSFTCSADIAGGTGQFINVMGTMTFTGTMDAVTRVTHAEWTGTLSHAKPFSGSYSAENGTVTNPSCNPGYTRRHAEGYGTALHFGDCFAVTEHCVNFSNGLVAGGEGSMTSANGDLITVTYNGYIVPIPGTTKVNATLLCKITGGTGKFDGAGGSMLLHAVQEMTTGVVTATFDGVIDY